MIRVLLLDDEVLALEYLETVIDWKGSGFEIIGTFTDARQALKAFRRERPELIISDICMVGMDGVDFAAAVRGIDQTAHILFLSGYKNFDYVQRAIRLGIDDYLLKSDINHDIFLNKLVQIRDRIERERQKTRYTENAVFREIFEKGVEEKNYKDMLSEPEYLRLHKRYYFLTASVKRWPPMLAQYFAVADDRAYIDEKAVSRRVADAAAKVEMDHVTAFRLDDTRILTLLEPCQGTVSEKESFEGFYSAVRGLFDELNQSEKQRFDLFYTRERFTVREFGRLYAQGWAQLEQVYVYREPRIYEFRRDVPGAPEPGAGRLSAEQLFQAIAQGKRAVLDELMESFRIAIGREDAAGYLRLLTLCMETFARVERERAEGSTGRYFNLVESSDSCDFSNPEEVARFIERKLAEAARLYQRDTGAVYSKSIQFAIDFIRENLSVEDLSAGMVARKVNLSPSWLSAKFKEEVGMGISEYLNSVRIQRAKALLRDGDFMIYEVSEQCGFASSQYFSKMFKQLTGMTPNEFRRTTKTKPRE